MTSLRVILGAYMNISFIIKVKILYSLSAHVGPTNYVGLLNLK